MFRYVTLALTLSSHPLCVVPPHLCVQLRILDVLLSVTERDERAAMLPDAFTPPGSTAGGRAGRDPGLTVALPCPRAWR